MEQRLDFKFNPSRYAIPLAVNYEQLSKHVLFAEAISILPEANGRNRFPRFSAMKSSVRSRALDRRPIESTLAEHHCPSAIASPGTCPPVAATASFVKTACLRNACHSPSLVMACGANPRGPRWSESVLSLGSRNNHRQDPDRFGLRVSLPGELCHRHDDGRFGGRAGLQGTSNSDPRGRNAWADIRGHRQKRSTVWNC